jgi:hypothetical protein
VHSNPSKVVREVWENLVELAEEEAKALLKDVFIGYSDAEDRLSVPVPTLKRVFHKYTNQLHHTGG